MNIEQINQMNRDRFVEYFGDVYEHSPWIPLQSHANSPFQDRDDLLAAMRKVLQAATQEQQITLIRAHPDLAGKAAIQGKLTESSSQEQAGVGLDQCTPDEFAHFTELNNRYKAKFDFPFIMAVKGATKEQVINGFESRMDNTVEEEFHTALVQINRIAEFRVNDLVDSTIGETS